MTFSINSDDFHIGLIHIAQNLPTPVPIRNVRLDVKVVDFVSEVIITQEYVNRESNPIEVLYSYPVEESAAIIGTYYFNYHISSYIY